MGWAGEGGKVRKNEEARPSRPEQVCGSPREGDQAWMHPKRGKLL